MHLLNLLDDFPFVYEFINKQNPKINMITTDSRGVVPGALFVCVKGYTVDGHDFAKDAVKKGAVCLLVERELSEVDIAQIKVKDVFRALSYLANKMYDYPTNDLHTIGITGTNGKTSITYILEEIFRKNKEKTALIGTIQMKIGDQIFPIKNTTPEPSYLFNSFQTMRNEKVDHCMMEVSSHALVEGRVRGIDFDVAIFTNLTQDHLDYHPTMTDYRLAKERLFQQLGNRYDPKRPKYAIINRDDSYAEFFIDATSQPVVTYGMTSTSDLYASDIQLSATSTTFTLNGMVDEVTIKSKLIGKFNVYNMLAATATALVCGVEIAVIKAALEAIPGVKGRFQPVQTARPYSVIVDYAHTPDSLKNVLETIKSFVHGKIYCVVGCGGDRDKSKRPLMAGVSDTYSDFTILTSDNPRSEEPLAILRDMEKGMTTKRYLIESDRKKAIEQAIDLATEEDVILIAGKGHETYQIIGNETLPFDDYQVAKDYLDKGVK
ncbi:UDP-N-acetylmuramoyl-L-alanyl-D-glutamate--2,6-diaminopimelate ligase [Halolactibacillus alkaliphilus]|uniref:UDP-N-acetylmuramoyl-L-alanyl-D-glutamate--2,6-diaminopimelate ligase n=1 Tax=Halolactibacillus alkaliphilus TaxID=442899 RepID=A0A511WZ76_9BACI|nr:UDP-N-acetylmuramoyl-L-alanyl-D-glutamate--2,6-diaminopimelate ligase [Halolactibacillus alkaliphilus]GEN55692.1 UDP-N-acetylmuramoyl-L-alanyl-D-glutamate--2,6-diaminopimelate ligase [Halolactibacillus alkaliphilus]GGN65371.1 UDP-N-acetylmuramoyl-L-alanyl-D-glutamate--2,6-diaminopimelate ligase [Halolactibacillus alkaliphilus]SFO63847.1 UDP-N-acetylmuramoylalanyl-D-glutamate--2,6-diaminopimelate ligase [Halolactibacillus alkaliphilus]